ncbi:type IV pilus biogenesis protein PilM [Alkalihalobacillus sp. 1P02AB]|uniref:type IV pilus biogenesis protein PilM n=1 Tax=Alkalihalobacillus sp. 1P02AB TaxID=3132260 RepID=UPI0039A424EB
MGFLSLFKQKRRHALILKDHVIRYIGSTKPEHESITTIDEIILPAGLIHDGLIVQEEELIELLSPYIEKWGLKNEKIQICIPDSQLIIRRHQVKKGLSKEEIKGQLYHELGETLLLPWEDPIFDVHTIEKGKKEDEVLLFAVQEKVVQQLILFFGKLSIELNALDVRSLCSYRLFSEQFTCEEQEEQLLVQMDQHSLTFTVFQKGRPLFFRHIFQESVEFMAEEDPVFSYVEQAYQEIERVINFYRFNVRVGKGKYSHLFLCGDHQNLSDLKNYLAEQLDFPVIQYKKLAEDESNARYYDSYGLVLKKEVH